MNIAFIASSVIDRSFKPTYVQFQNHLMLILHHVWEPDQVTTYDWKVTSCRRIIGNIQCNVGCRLCPHCRKIWPWICIPRF